MSLERIRSLLGAPPYAALFAEVRKRLEEDGELARTATLRDASDEERQAVADLFGWRVIPEGRISVSLEKLDRELRDGEPQRLTLRELANGALLPLADEPLFVCENPSVVAAAADRLGSRCRPLVCTEGIPSTAGAHPPARARPPRRPPPRPCRFRLGGDSDREPAPPRRRRYTLALPRRRLLGSTLGRSRWGGPGGRGCGRVVGSGAGSHDAGPWSRGVRRRGPRSAPRGSRALIGGRALGEMVLVEIRMACRPSTREAERAPVGSVGLRAPSGGPLEKYRQKAWSRGCGLRDHGRCSYRADFVGQSRLASRPGLGEPDDVVGALVLVSAAQRIGFGGEVCCRPRDLYRLAG